MARTSWKPDPDVLPVTRTGRAGSDARTWPTWRRSGGASGEPQKDALAVLDVDAGSARYGQVVGWTEMPHVGDELHHHGWNACSSRALPEQPAPARRAAVPAADGAALEPDPLRRRQGRPAQPEGRQGHRAGRLPEGHRLQPPAHRPLRARGHLHHRTSERAHSDDGPGGIALLDHDTFEIKGQWEADRGDQYLAYDFWWHINHDVLVASEWGTPSMIEDGLVPEMLLGQPVRPPAALLRPQDPQAAADRRPRRRAPDGPGAAAGARPDPAVRLRRRGDQHRGPVRLRVALAPRGRRVRGRPR